MTILDKFTYATRRNLSPICRPIASTWLLVTWPNAALVELLVANRTRLPIWPPRRNDNSLDDPTPFVMTNLVGTFVLLQAVRKHDVRLHHVSTDEVYGDLDLDDPTRFTEDTRYRPSSPYPATKAGSDPLGPGFAASACVRRSPTQTTRGPGSPSRVHTSAGHRGAGGLAAARLRCRPPGSRLDPRRRPQCRTLAILERGRIGETYLVGADGERTNRDVVRRMLRLTGRPEDGFELVTDRAGHEVRYAIDSNRLRLELGWQPGFADFESGLAESIDWYRGHRHWWAPHKQATEAAYAAEGQ